MNDKQHHSGNGFFAGFLVGVLLTLLLVTKKGRKILKSLTDEGVGSIEDFLGEDVEEAMSDEVLQEEPQDGEESEPLQEKKRLFRNLRKKKS